MHPIVAHFPIGLLWDSVAFDALARPMLDTICVAG